MNLSQLPSDFSYLNEKGKLAPNFKKTLKEWSQVLNMMPEAFFKTTTLLTLDSHKISVSNQTQKGVYKSAIVYMLQGDLAGHEVCPFRTKSCSDNCLGTNSGHSALVKKGNNTNAVQISRLRKTIMFTKFRELFRTKLLKELTNFVNKAEKEGVKAAFRFNGTSDMPFHTLKLPNSKTTFINHFSEVEFYDYTKSIGKARKYARGEFPKNYAVVYSYTPEKENDAMEALYSGINVAVAFAEKSSKVRTASFLGKSFLNHEIVNGDAHDLRFMEYKEGKMGVVIGLTAKGNHFKNDETGFFVDPARTELLLEVA